MDLVDIDKVLDDLEANEEDTEAIIQPVSLVLKTDNEESTETSVKCDPKNYTPAPPQDPNLCNSSLTDVCTSGIHNFSSSSDILVSKNCDHKTELEDPHSTEHDLTPPPSPPRPRSPPNLLENCSLSVHHPDVIPTLEDVSYTVDVNPVIAGYDLMQLKSPTAGKLHLADLSEETNCTDEPINSSEEVQAVFHLESGQDVPCLIKNVNHDEDKVEVERDLCSYSNILCSLMRDDEKEQLVSISASREKQNSVTSVTSSTTSVDYGAALSIVPSASRKTSDNSISSAPEIDLKLNSGGISTRSPKFEAQPIIDERTEDRNDSPFDCLSPEEQTPPQTSLKVDVPHGSEPGDGGHHIVSDSSTSDEGDGTFGGLALDVEPDDSPSSPLPVQESQLEERAMTNEEIFSGPPFTGFYDNQTGVEVDSEPEPDDVEPSERPQQFQPRSLISSVHEIRSGVADLSNFRLTESELQLGKLAPFWIPDKDSALCMLCETKFTPIRRRHHCRACGRVLCGPCTNERAQLSYMNLKPCRVCKPCALTLRRIDEYEFARLIEQRDNANELHSHDAGNLQQPCTEDAGSFGAIPDDSSCVREGSQSVIPDPRNPNEYCSRVPVAEQIGEHRSIPLPAVMVPTSVLKTRKPNTMSVTALAGQAGAGGTSAQLAFERSISPTSKRVMFSDGIKPGGDLQEINSAQSSSGWSRAKSSANSGRLTASELECFIPKQQRRDSSTTASCLPLLTNAGEDNDANLSAEDVLRLLEDPQAKPLAFKVKKNLVIRIKIVELDCCVGQKVWNFCSDGLCCVGQDEVVILLEKQENETEIPVDVLRHYNAMYDEAFKGNPVSDLGHTVFATTSVLEHVDANAGFLGSKDNIGFMYVRPTFQDLRNFSYTIPSIMGSSVTLEGKNTVVQIPKEGYSEVLKVLSRSNEHVLAFGTSFCESADSYLVCVQTENGSYETQAISIQNRPTKVTAGSFVVFNGSLKSDSSDAKSSLVEDGVMIQLKTELMESLREKLKNEENMEFSCADSASDSEAGKIVIEFVDKVDGVFAFDIPSPVDGQSLKGLQNLRFHGKSSDVACSGKLLRLTEMFFHSGYNTTNSTSLAENGDVVNLAKTIAASAGVALVPYAKQLCEADLKRIGLRVSLGPDTVEYVVGSNGHQLPQLYMPSLDTELIPVLHEHAGAQSSQIMIELILYILDA